MSPEEMKAEADKMEEAANVQFLLAFTNFQRQLGGVATLRTNAEKERKQTVETSKEKSDGN